MKKTRIAAVLAVGAALLVGVRAQAGSWQNNAPFGAALQGDLYSPTTPGASAGVLVAIHYCTGNKSKAHGWFDSSADANGFYIVAPDAGKQCFDSSATRGGDRAAIVKMVDYVVQQKGADKSRVFAAGFSSGGCMTNTLLAIYPDVFAGGAAMPGFPAGGWPAGDTSCTKCGSSPPSTDGKYWGDIARNAYSWSGAYPCSQQWVGGNDEYNFDGWLPAVVAQWQNLAGLDKGGTGSGAPSGWNRTVYKDAAGNVRLETNVKPGQAHDLTSAGLSGYVVTFLGLDKPTGACGVTGSGTGGTGGTGGGSGTGGATGGAGGAGGAGGTSGADGAIDVRRDAREAGRDLTGSGGGAGSGGTSAGGSGGTTQTGGFTGSGGGSAAGGSTDSGGRTGTGGTGGSAGSGGRSESGGSGSGGSVASGGSGAGGTDTGGAMSSGGGSGSGGASGGGQSGGASTAVRGGSSGGCSFAAGAARGGTLAMLALLGLAWLAVSRRDSVRRQPAGDISPTCGAIPPPTMTCRPKPMQAADREESAARRSPKAASGLAMPAGSNASSGCRYRA
jgi:acetylxylan esterase